MNAEDVLIVLPVSSTVLCPGVVLPIAITGNLALAAAQEAVRTQRRVGLLLQTDPGVAPTAGDQHRVGTAAATIVRFITAPDGTHHLIAQGEERFTVIGLREPRALPRGAHRNSQRTHGSCCRRRPGNWSTRSAVSSRFRRSPTWWRASWI